MKGDDFCTTVDRSVYAVILARMGVIFVRYREKQMEPAIRISLHSDRAVLASGSLRRAPTGWGGHAAQERYRAANRAGRMGRAEYMFKIVIVVRCLESQRPPRSRVARNTPS